MSKRLGGLLCWEWKPLAKGFMEVSGVLHQAIRAIWQHCCLLLTRSIRQALQNLSNICIHTDRLPLDLLRANRLSLVDTGVDCVRVLRRHLPEGILDDDGGVIANAQLQKEDFLSCVSSEEIFIPLCASLRPPQRYHRCGGSWSKAFRSGGRQGAVLPGFSCPPAA